MTRTMLTLLFVQRTINSKSVNVVRTQNISRYTIMARADTEVLSKGFKLKFYKVSSHIIKYKKYYETNKITYNKNSQYQQKLNAFYSKMGVL